MIALTIELESHITPKTTTATTKTTETTETKYFSFQKVTSNMH